MGEFEACIAFISNEGLNKKTELYVEKLRNIEIETEWGLYGAFLDVIEEMYPNEFENALAEYRRRYESDNSG